MRKLPTAGIFATLLATSPTSIVAEPATGSRVDPAPMSVTSKEMEAKNASIRVMNKFGRCVAHQRSRTAVAILALPYLSSEQSKATRAVLGGQDVCIGLGSQELEFQPPAIVGALAEELIVERFPNADVSWMAGMSDDEMDKRGMSPRTLAEDFAQCVVRKDPQTVLQIINSDPASGEEKSLVNRIAPNLGPCFVQGQSVNLTPESVRSVVALGLYRMLDLNSQAQAAK